jgi:outer membrane lipoprotein SlyB
MIFPGLGTIGGALLGGVGGHEYGKGKSRGKNHERSPVSSGRRTRRYSNEEAAEYRRRKY